MKALMITLGHNASALFYDGKSKPIGYEEERLSGVKGDSSFPRLSIQEILKHADISHCKIFVSHWFDNFDLSKARQKYYDQAYMLNLCKEYTCTIHGLNDKFTHHDAHAYSSLAFFEDNYVAHFDGKQHFIVADGFGNKGEVLSIYERRGGGEMVLLHRAFNYENSLGLMYQYACSFCGMKENQDEYKFLGYESAIQDEIDAAKLKDLNQYIKSQAAAVFASLMVSTVPTHIADEHIDLDRLGEVKKRWHNTFRNVLFALFDGDEDYDVTTKRVVVGYYIQSIIEEVLYEIIMRFNIENVCLSGGCFYNVKLNNLVMKSVDGNISVMPLAGDQGAAIGMYRKYFREFKFFDLCYGKRNLRFSAKDFKDLSDDNFEYFEYESKFVARVKRLLKENKIVNIMRGDMEFGPRALCRTSTLALPTEENVQYINMINGRNTVMPMAPVMSASSMWRMLHNYSGELTRVVGSHKYMIITHDVSLEYALNDNFSGVTHQYPTEEKYSARPQVVAPGSDPIMEAILSEIDEQVLINTSYNTHGTPILFTKEDGVRDFLLQRQKDSSNRVHLMILGDEQK